MDELAIARGRDRKSGRSAASCGSSSKPRSTACRTTFRAVFVLRDVEGLSTAETAESLSIPEETVKTRLHRARRQLRRQLDRVMGQRR